MELSRPLVVLDLEATGIWIEKDKIVEIAMIKCLPTGERETFREVVNPGILIPQNVVELIGISNEDVKDKPIFREIAQSVFQFIGDADLAGFNSDRFDLPLLDREMREAGYDLEIKNRKTYDAQKVYHINEKRDLTAAYQFFCGKTLENAHTALADTEATLAVLEAQVEKYGDGQKDISVLSQFDYQQLQDFLDRDKRLRWWNGKLYLMFGKYARKYSLNDLVERDPKYLEWVLSADFNDEVKSAIEEALQGNFPKPQ